MRGDGEDERKRKKVTGVPIHTYIHTYIHTKSKSKSKSKSKI